MFNLESSILEWRQQMLAAGISAPALDELEGHLREEIQNQMKSGRDESSAFTLAVKKIGQPSVLNVEFNRSRGLMRILGDDAATRKQRVLGLIWLSILSGAFFQTLAVMVEFFYTPDFPPAGFIPLVTMALISLWGTYLGMRLYGGEMHLRRWLWMLALVWSAGDALALLRGQYHEYRPFLIGVFAFTLFDMILAWISHPSRANRIHKNSGKWERYVSIAVWFGGILPLALYSLFKYDMNWTWRFAGIANIVLVTFAILGCRYINTLFPVIPNRRIRWAIGISAAAAGMAGMGIFANFILPRFSLTEGQLTVVVLWGLTLMAPGGAVLAGLEEAVKRTSVNA